MKALNGILTQCVKVLEQLRVLDICVPGNCIPDSCALDTCVPRQMRP